MRLFRWVRENWVALLARTSITVVAVIAGAASWQHIASVAYDAGERLWVASLLPLSIDGLIVAGVMALVEDKQQNRVPRMSARLAVVIGVAATLAANLASAEPNWTSRLVAVTAPVCFLASVEVLTRRGRKRAEEVVEAPAVAEPTPEPEPKKKAAQRATSAAHKVVEILKKDPEAAKNIHRLARRAGVSWGTARRVVDAEMS